MVDYSDTHTDQYLDFLSHHPLAHKVAVVRTLLDRADKVCTFVAGKDAEREHVTRALQNNGYSRSIVDQNRHTTSLPPPSQEQDPPKAVVTLPYIRHLSVSIPRILDPLGICTCFCPYLTLRGIFVYLKDHIPHQQRSGVVYRIPCGTCTKVYIGQTSRTLEHQLKEHRRALVLGEISLSAVTQLKISEWLGSISYLCSRNNPSRSQLDRWRSQIRRSDPNPGFSPMINDYKIWQGTKFMGK